MVNTHWSSVTKPFLFAARYCLAGALLLLCALFTRATSADDKGNDVGTYIYEQNEWIREFCGEKGKLAAKTCELIGEAIQELDVSTSLTIFDIALLNDLVDLSLDVEPGTRPSNFGGEYLQEISYGLKGGINVHEIVDAFREKHSTVLLGAGGKAEIDFIRQYTHQWDTIKTLPKNIIKWAPFSSDRVLKMKPGDFTRIPVSMNVYAGFRTFSDNLMNILSGHLGLKFSAETKFVIDGQFEFRVFRMTDDWARISLFAVKSNGDRESGRLKLDFDITGIVDKLLDEVVGTDLVKISASKRSRNIYFLTDYVINLGKAEVRQAYDNLFKLQVLSKKGAKFLNPVQWNPEKLHDILVSDLTAFEDLWLADERRPPSRLRERRVYRPFRGHNDQVESHISADIGNRLAKAKWGLSYTTNCLTRYEKENEKTHYSYPEYVKKMGLAFLWKFLYEDDVSRGYALLESDPECMPTRFHDLGITIDSKDKFMGAGERREKLARLERQIPNPWLTQVKNVWKDWALRTTKESGTIERARIFYRILFHEVALDLLHAQFQKAYRNEPRAQTYDEWLPEYIVEKFKVYYSTVPSMPELVGSSRNMTFCASQWECDNRAEIASFSRDLATIVNPSHSAKDRISSLEGLRRNPIFTKMGPGYLGFLIGEDRLTDAAYFYMELHGRPVKKTLIGPEGKERVYDKDKSVWIAEIGEDQKKSLYEYILYLYSSFDNEFDPRQYPISINVFANGLKSGNISRRLTLEEIEEINASRIDLGRMSVY